MDSQQQARHDEMMKALLDTLNSDLVIGMNLNTLFQVMLDFFAGGLFYACETTGHMEFYDHAVVAGEVKQRMMAMVEQAKRGAS